MFFIQTFSLISIPCTPLNISHQICNIDFKMCAYKIYLYLTLIALDTYFMYKQKCNYFGLKYTVVTRGENISNCVI